MSKTIFKSLIILIGIFSISSGVTGSYLSDQVTVSSNQFTAGTWPTPALNIVINEVYYDVDSLHKGPDPEDNYEWIELYNPNNFPISLKDWTITDNTQTSIIHAEKSIPANGFALISKSANIWNNYWNINPGNPGANIEIIELGQIIGSGLANTGDRVILKNSSGAVIDQISYGTDATILNPSIPDIVEGHSLERNPLGYDTDTAADFIDKSEPTPGH